MRKGPIMKVFLRLTVLLSVCFLFLAGCQRPGDPNMPYEPDTPAPDPHSGTFTAEDSSMTFNGDDSTVELVVGEKLAAASGLKEGNCSGTYRFLSGDLPPGGSVPVRYDAAHEFELTVDGETMVWLLGEPDADGKTFTVGIGTVSEERIPIIFRTENGYLTFVFEKK